MSIQQHAGDLMAFRVQTWPAAVDLGKALERNQPMAGARLQLRFGEQVANLRVTDLWSTCCELLLQAQLVREGKLDRFVVDVEHIFDLRYESGVALCSFSREHVFAVDAAELAASLEQSVAEIFAGTSCPRLMHVAARWAASDIRAQPYSFRFSDSELT